MPSLTEAIQQKYCSSNFEDIGPEDGSFIILAPKRIAEKTCVPSVLILNEYKIDSAGDFDFLKSECNSVTELDLSHNNLKNWDQVFQIFIHIPQLKFVNLSFNELNNVPDETAFGSRLSLPSLETLVLNNTKIDWKLVWRLLYISPNLKEIHLSLNEFSSICTLEAGEKHVKVEKVMFAGNFVYDWEEIGKIGKIFPMLQSLSLSDCSLKLQNIGDSIRENFPELKHLNISSTLIESEKEIANLNIFPKLDQVRLTGIPFLADIPDKEKRQEIIAMLPRIEKLNGGAQISVEEKDAAERYFIRKYMDKENKPQRYYELIQRHGKLEPLVDLDLKPATKIKLKIKFGHDQEIDQIVNVRQSVRQFKKILEPIIGLEASRMQLYYTDPEVLMIKEIMKFPDKLLYSYNMHDGDEIIVESKNNSSRNLVACEGIL